MKKLLLLLLSILALTGCKESATGDTENTATIENEVVTQNIENPLFQYLSNSTLDRVMETGVLVYIHSNYFNHPIATTEEIDKWWIETQECVGLTADPPVIFIVDEIPMGPDDVNLVIGQTSNSNPTFILIHSEYATHLNFIRIVWKHEFVHYLLKENGLDTDNDHTNLDVWKCEFWDNEFPEWWRH